TDLKLGPKSEPAAKAADAASVEPAPAPKPEPAAAPPVAAKPAAKVARVEPSHGPATKIVSLTQADEGGQLSITVQADGALHYQDFFLGNPDRLVVDFKDVTSHAPVHALDVQKGPVKKVRLAQFSAASPKVARLVLDLAQRSPYRIVEGTDGVKVVFG